MGIVGRVDGGDVTRIGKVTIDEWLWQNRTPAFDDFLKELDIKIKMPPQYGSHHITIIAEFNEFDDVEIKDLETDVPSYMFYFHRHQDGTVTRDKATRIEPEKTDSRRVSRRKNETSTSS